MPIQSLNDFRAFEGKWSGHQVKHHIPSTGDRGKAVFATLAIIAILFLCMEAFLTHGRFTLISALAVFRSFRMMAKMASFAGFSAVRKSSYLATRCGSRRMATKASI